MAAQVSSRSDPCKFFHTPKGCKRGDACRYSHVAEAAKKPLADCKFYFGSGFCKNGDRCRFNHTVQYKDEDLLWELRKAGYIPCPSFLKTAQCAKGLKVCRYSQHVSRVDAIDFYHRSIE